MTGPKVSVDLKKFKRGTSGIRLASSERLCICFCMLLAILLGPLFERSLLAVSYTVEGRLTYETFPDPDTPIPNLSNFDPTNRDRIAAFLAQPHEYERVFALHYNDCTWNLTVQLIGDTNWESAIYQYDGTNIISYNVPTARIATNYTHFGGAVDQTPVPRRTGDSGAECVWLAYASECYFGALTNDKVLWFDDVQSSLGFHKRIELPCVRAMSTLSPLLPTEVYYTLTSLPSLDPNGNLDLRPLAKPFQDGYTIGEFKASGSTNTGGLTFPTGFSFIQYAPKLKATTTNDLMARVKVSGAVSKITAGPWDWSDPAKNHKLFVKDFRVGQRFVDYGVSNEAIPAMGSPELRKITETAARNLLAQEEAEKNNIRGRRSLPIFLVISILTLPVMLFLFAKLAQKLKKTNQKNK